MSARVRLQDLGVDMMMLIADYQVLTDRDVADRLTEHVEDLVLDYLAAGIDPDRSTIFTHSATPAVAPAVPQPGLGRGTGPQPHGQGRDRRPGCRPH